MEQMNIRCKPGHKVMVTEDSITNGNTACMELASEHLKVGGIYTIASIDVGGSYTDVFLEEIPNIKFNSVNFVDYDADYKEPLKWEVEMIVSSKVTVFVEGNTLEDAKEDAKTLVKEFPMVLDLRDSEVKEIVSVKQINEDDTQHRTGLW